MRLEVKRDELQIVPEGEIDEAYIEHVLGMRHEGDKCDVSFVPVFGVSRLAYVRLRKEDA